MQRFSPDIPWVLIETDPQGYLFSLYCEVCRATGIGDRNAAGQFAAAHVAHTAPEGSLRLGDAFAAMAKPVARAFGVNMPCSPCEARRRAMNAVRFR